MIDAIHIHPMIVHFPIALLIVAFLFDVISLFIKEEFYSKAGFYLLILGTLGVIAAFFTGNLAGSGISESGKLKDVLETHEEAALISMSIMIIAAVVRIIFVWKKKYYGVFKYVALTLILICVFSIARTGFYGGELVFKHAAGVRFELGMD